MIIGIGTDLVDIRRIGDLHKKHGDRFLEKTFTKEERDGAEKYSSMSLRHAYFAKRFAAKEAFSKALGTGLGDSVRFLDISVGNHPSGQPFLTISGKTKAYIEKCYPDQQIKIDLTLADEYPMAQAFVTLSALK